MPLFAQWACKGPCGEQKGKALSGATIGSVVANSPLSGVGGVNISSREIARAKRGLESRFPLKRRSSPARAAFFCFALSETMARTERSQVALSAPNNLQEVDFQSCRFFLCPKSCTKNASIPFSVISVNKNAPCFYTQGIAFYVGR